MHTLPIEVVALAHAGMDFDMDHPEAMSIERFTFAPKEVIREDGQLHHEWRRYRYIGAAHITITPLPRPGITNHAIEVLLAERERITSEHLRQIADVDAAIAGIREELSE